MTRPRKRRVSEPTPTTSGALERGVVVRRELAESPGQTYYVYVPSTATREAPLLVAVHGASRNAEEQARLFANHCDEYGAILVAPHFGARRSPEYRRLSAGGNEKPANGVLDAIVAEVARLTGTRASRIHLFGFSTGAQLAHRYALVHPERVARAVIACAASYTHLDARKRFPRGIRPSRKLPCERFDVDAFLRVPLLVVAGEPQVGDRALRRVEPEVTPRKESRAETARSWVAELRAAAEERGIDSLTTYREVPGGSQSFRQFMRTGPLGQVVLEWLLGPVPSRALVVVPTYTRDAHVLPSDGADGAPPAPPGVWQRRTLLRAALCAGLLVITVPLARLTYYRSGHVVSRNAVVKGHISDVGAQIDGVVRSMEVDVGDHVRAGQIVARLEDRHIRARLEKANSQLEKSTRELAVERLTIENERARLGTGQAEAQAGLGLASARLRATQSAAAEARRKLELQQRLAVKGLVAEERVRAAESELRSAMAQVDAASAERDAASAGRDAKGVDTQGLGIRTERLGVLESEISSLEAEVALAQANLDQTAIRAPGDGAVVRRIVEPGGSTVVGQPIVSIWIGEKIWVEAWVDEEDIADIAVGSPVTVTLTPYPDRDFEGVVEKIGVSTDFELPDSAVPQPRQERMRGAPLVGVRVGLAERAEVLIPGLSAVVGIRKRDD